MKKDNQKKQTLSCPLFGVQFTKSVDLYDYYEELVSRKLSFRQAIHNAFLSYFNNN